ncbi:hypothetical protein UFOVP418_30 [uncultured Caudovirales phage]|uniref:Uncharacterized protein n=1 Tax=uncultured Caudovirales phage TaxID=2100421 RepID=A0A6J5M5S2_9CAUD|nr:hypothetical protein UFOVP418_30 [uncultured Caudovirales phage]
MADNVGYTPGTGATIAADEIGGVLHQRVKVGIGADGQATDLSTSNPMPTQEQGELVEAIEALRMAVASLTKTIGVSLPNASGQQVVEIRQSTAANTNVTAAIAGGSTLGTVTTVGTVSTVTNQSQIGGYVVNDYMPALYHLQADNLRRNISVS